MSNYLKENNVKVKDGTDVNSIMRDMMSTILEGALVTLPIRVFCVSFKKNFYGEGNLPIVNAIYFDKLT